MVLLALALVALEAGVAALVAQMVKITLLVLALVLAVLMVVAQVAHGVVVLALPHLARLAQFVLSGRAQPAHSHQQIQDHLNFWRNHEPLY
jgi:hypothetical protein